MAAKGKSRVAAGALSNAQMLALAGPVAASMRMKRPSSPEIRRI